MRRLGAWALVVILIGAGVALAFVALAAGFAEGR